MDKLKLDFLKTDRCTFVKKSSVLQRVQDFLPSLAAANKQLNERQKIEGKDCCDLEVLDDPVGPVIEMDVALYAKDDDNSDTSSDDDDSSSDDAENCDCDELNCSCTKKAIYGELSESNLKIPKQSTRIVPKSNGPLIQELPNSDEKIERTRDEQSGKQLSLSDSK